MLTEADLLRSLTALNLHFPQAGRSPQELQSIAQDWMEDLAAFSPQVVAQAVKSARRELDFFPTTRQMLELCTRASQELERWQARALPEPAVMDKPEISDETRKLIEQTKKRLAARMTFA